MRAPLCSPTGSGRYESRYHWTSPGTGSRAVSKERARTRAQRQADAARHLAGEHARREKDVAERARRERRSLAWRRMRLWQHGSGFRRRKDSWAALGTLAMVVLLLAYLLTSSWHVVLLVVLVLVIAFPALVMLTFDRRNE